MSHPADLRRQMSCEGKRSFPTFALAKQTAKRVSQRRHSKLTPYKCKWCGRYHVGGSNPVQTVKKPRKP